MDFRNKEYLKSEENTYSIKIRDQDGTTRKVGYAVISVRVGDDIVEFFSKTYIENGEFCEESCVQADAASLKPLRCEVNISGKNGGYNLTAHYKPAEIHMVARTPTGEHKKKLPLDEDVYDNAQLLSLIRLLDFNNTSIHNIPVLPLQAGSIFNMEIKYIGEEAAIVDSEQMACVRFCVVNSAAPDIKQYVLYSNDDRRRLVRVSSGNQFIEPDHG